MLVKRIATAALICTIALTAAACTKNDAKNDASQPAATASASASAASSSENPELSKTQAYIAARLAEEKVDSLFHEATSQNKKPILNPVAPDKEAASKFLTAYMDPALAEKVLSHYLTEEKADNAIVVKSDKFFAASIREMASKDDVTIDGTADEYKITTKNGGVFTVKKNAENKYILSDFAKN